MTLTNPESSTVSQAAPATLSQPVPRSAATIVGAAFIIGGIATIVFNVLFPRADDPADIPQALTTFGENEVLRQICFLGVLAGLWTIGGGMLWIARRLQGVRGSEVARLASFAIVIGLALFTASAGIGLATTGAAVDWLDSGASTTSTEYAIAAALDAVDNGVWAISVVALWLGFGLLGTAMVRAKFGPAWSGWALLMLGIAVAAAAGVPMAVGAISQATMLLFAGLAMLTSLWVVVMGGWLLRQRQS
jgi:hypothetical protein